MNRLVLGKTSAQPGLDLDKPEVIFSDREVAVATSTAEKPIMDSQTSPDEIGILPKPSMAIVGFDREGRASFEYFRAQGATITICDQNPNIDVPKDIPTQLGPEYLKNLDRFDVIMRTPGLHPKNILAENPSVQDKIWSGTNEFFKVCPTKNIIGVTGTKGKGTTSTLITKMLQAAGYTVHLAGNIGLPALDILPTIRPEDWVVLELSSFQLSDIRLSPHIATCLMVVPEHLNWHSDLTEYIEAKANLFRQQTRNDIAIYYANNDVSLHIASSGAGQQVPFYTTPGAVIDNGAISINGQDVCKTSELKLLGQHNWQNVCAAVTTIWQVTQDIAGIKSVLTTFGGLEHRLELVREIDGVRYYDDSFGTTPETAIVAIQAFHEPKIVILGGSDKGASYDELAKTVASSNVRAVLLIGDQAKRIGDALHAAGYDAAIDGGNTMTEIVANAQTIAQPGDVVLLSTGCASFGMFTDYKDRAAQFVTAVQSLV